MSRRRSLRFLLSGDAIAVHLICLTLLVVLPISLLTGEAQPDYVWGLVFTIVVYPLLLILLWWSDRLDDRAAVDDAVQSVTAPIRRRRNRRRWRVGVLAVVAALAVWLIYAGHNGMRVELIPAQFVGYFLFALVGLAMAGVNVWYGGPLDLRLDQSQPVWPEPFVEIGSEPDQPIGFGRKNLWIAARAPSAEALAETLGLTEVQTSNWRSGFVAAYAWPSSYVFVTPPVNGWVLAVGAGLPDPSGPATVARWRRLMTNISEKFGVAQFYASHRVSSYSAWGFYENGIEKRLFAWADDTIHNSGSPLPEEEDRMRRLADPTCAAAETDEYWEREDLWEPREDDVLELAGRWSVDPITLDSLGLPPSVGLVGRLVDRQAPHSELGSGSARQ